MGRGEVEVVLLGVDRPLYFYESFFRGLRRVSSRVPVLLLFGEGAGERGRWIWRLVIGWGSPFWWRSCGRR